MGRCALVLTGGVAKGAFHSGVLKSFAEANVTPSVIVGSSAGSLNGAMAAKLIAENNFTPAAIDQHLTHLWIEEGTIQNLWGDGTIQDLSLRSILGEKRLSVFMLRRLVDFFKKQSPSKLRDIFSFKFTSVLSDQFLSELIDELYTPPKKIINSVHFSAAVSDLSGEVQTYNNQTIIDHGGYHTFHFKEGMVPSEIGKVFNKLKLVIRASSCFPGMFPPVKIKVNKQERTFVDGGLTKNAPFGRAIKLDNEVQDIFLISSVPITRPVFEEVDNMFNMIGQVYRLILNRDLSNDYRKIMQINERIQRVNDLLKRDRKGQLKRSSSYNLAVLSAAGFKSWEHFLGMRKVNITIIEPDELLEGDPFAGFYSKDRKRLMNDYVNEGYTTGRKVITQFLKSNPNFDK